MEEMECEEKENALETQTLCGGGEVKEAWRRREGGGDRGEETVTGFSGCVARLIGTETLDRLRMQGQGENHWVVVTEMLYHKPSNSN